LIVYSLRTVLKDIVSTCFSFAVCSWRRLHLAVYNNHKLVSPSSTLPLPIIVTWLVSELRM
jgi:hypothetical protein